MYNDKVLFISISYVAKQESVIKIMGICIVEEYEVSDGCLPHTNIFKLNWTQFDSIAIHKVVP